MSAATPSVGALCDRLGLQRKVTTEEPEGGAAVAYVPMASVWGRVRALSARPARTADGRAATQTHSVVLRFRGDIGPGDRFAYRGRWLEVLSADDLNGRRAWLSCACTETRMVGAAP